MGGISSIIQAPGAMTKGILQVSMKKTLQRWISWKVCPRTFIAGIPSSCSGQTGSGITPGLPGDESGRTLRPIAEIRG